MRIFALCVLVLCLVPQPLRAEEAQAVTSPATNLFVEHFYIPPEQRLQQDTIETQGFVFVEAPPAAKSGRYAIVTDFGGSVLKTRNVPGIDNLQDMRNWVRKSMESATFEGVEIRRLRFAAESGKGDVCLYWVGHRAFASPDAARAEILSVKTAVESKGGNFAQMVQAARTAMRLPEEQAPVEIKSPSQQAKEERMMLKFLDQMDVGDKLFGPFTGVAPGEPILWQSFGETSWRKTNLENHNFRDQVGFWTNRVVFKGIKAPLNTINPYLEATTALETNGLDYKSNFKLWAGLEWRPFERNAWLSNYQPFGIPLLKWIQNYRLYVQYGNRFNIKDEIAGSANHDLIYGAQIFYEFGVDPPPLDQAPPEGVTEFLERYVWGEYFGDYRWEMTDFTGEDNFNAWILNSSVILGLKLPGIPLPSNPLTDKLVLMPYMRFEHTNNTEFSFPYQNQYFVVSGVRWMPFANYRWKENEWLAKTKIFFEFVGVGKVQHVRYGDHEVPYAIRDDIRFGVNISSKRF